MKAFIKKYAVFLLLAVYEAAAYLAWGCLKNAPVLAEPNSLRSLLLAWVFLAPAVAAAWYAAKKFPEEQKLKAVCRPLCRGLAIVLLLITVSSVIVLLFPGVSG